MYMSLMKIHNFPERAVLKSKAGNVKVEERSGNNNNNRECFVLNASSSSCQLPNLVSL